MTSEHGAAEPERRPRRFGFAVTGFLLAGSFILDLLSGNEVSSSLFYVVPVAIGAWFLGRPAGLVLAALSTVAWLAAEIAVGPSFARPAVLTYNVAAESVIYLVTAWVVSRVHADALKQRLLNARIAEARDALDRETRAVGELQRQLLPERLPERSGYEWAIHYATSSRAGGDGYDAIELDDGRVGVLIVDATGHGAPAAVLMGMGRALLHAGPEPAYPPEAVLSRLDTRLSRVLPAGWFLTACYVILDPPSGRLDYAVAGHPPPLVVRSAGGVVELLSTTGGMPLAPFPERGYTPAETTLEPGDTLVLITDGVLEAMDRSGEMFGNGRLRFVLARAARLETQTMLRMLTDALAAHTDGAPATDDLTVVMLRRTKPALATEPASD